MCLIWGAPSHRGAPLGLEDCPYSHSLPPPLPPLPRSSGKPLARGSLQSSGPRGFPQPGALQILTATTPGAGGFLHSQILGITEAAIPRAQECKKSQTLVIAAAGIPRTWGFHSGHGAPLQLGVVSANGSPSHSYMCKIKLNSNQL